MLVFDPLESSPAILQKPWLNFDLLFLIMEFLPRRSLCKMMRTCRTLHDAGIRLLLSQKCYLFTEAQLSSFCRFVLGDAPLRSSFLRELNIAEEIGENTVALLIEVLLQARSLKKLTIQPEPHLFESHPDLVDAICSLPSLKSLDWHDVGDPGVEVIRHMQASLEVVEVSFINCDQPQDPAEVLKRSANTIRDLRANYVVVAPSTIQFTALQYLRLRATSDPIDTSVLMSMYPNVLSLYLESPLLLFDDDEEQWNEMRQVNERRAQSSNRWAILAEVAGNIFALWTLALNCKVVTLTVSPIDREDLAPLSTLLRGTDPFRLRLTVSLGRDISIDLLGDLLVGATSMKQLELAIHVGSSATDSGPQILSGILSMLEPLTITWIDLVVDGTRSTRESPATTAADYLDHAEDRSFGGELFNRVPSLNLIKLKLGSNPKSHWSFNSMDG
ncbi:hypothetical protein CERSUDRAFT_100756 [Gelatoporia subvermispora B]|uniref:F-box domain-containing protein n=1 Tax=Ceriporiopsis subvermispora (strain B) TaxID=914234 RepID=M2QWY5_CERS8|nr:hypothetical protein CERSUDRAFT_100756 [Gelatoporia subvermispora B]